MTGTVGTDAWPLESGGRRWFDHDPWLVLGGVLVLVFLGWWLASPGGDGGPAVARQLVLLGLFVVPAVLVGGVLAGFAGIGTLAAVVRWFVVLLVGFWVLGIVAALTFATGDPRCGDPGHAGCRTSAVARLTGLAPTSATWLVGRGIAVRIEARRRRPFVTGSDPEGA